MFAEYYKSVTNINLYVSKSFVSQLQLVRMALEYISEIRHIFSEQKYQTMEKFQQIKRNMNKKKAYGK